MLLQKNPVNEQRLNPFFFLILRDILPLPRQFYRYERNDSRGETYESQDWGYAFDDLPTLSVHWNIKGALESNQRARLDLIAIAEVSFASLKNTVRRRSMIQYDSYISSAFTCTYQQMLLSSFFMLVVQGHFFPALHF